MLCSTINCMFEHVSDWTTNLRYWVKYIAKSESPEILTRVNSQCHLSGSTNVQY
jgi:hypothetical protein